MCSIVDCQNYRVYGYENNKPLVCNKHKKEGMINVRNAICQSISCERKALYGYNFLEPTHCDVHIEKTMINVYCKTNKRQSLSVLARSCLTSICECVVDDCTEKGVYYFPIETNVICYRYCYKHKIPNMITDVSTINSKKKKLDVVINNEFRSLANNISPMNCEEKQLYFTINKKRKTISGNIRPSSKFNCGANMIINDPDVPQEFIDWFVLQEWVE